VTPIDPGPAVRVRAPVGGVLTPALGSLGFEPGDPSTRIAAMTRSHHDLDEIGAPTMSLDGSTVLIARTPETGTS
jgi:hypothetical protein